MARPSLKDQRSSEILEAYLQCVARYGLDGATQDRIAEKAGVKRPLLRHYLGNKDQMVRALTDHVIARFDASIANLEAALATVCTPENFVDLLFYQDDSSEPDLVLAWQALVVASSRDVPLREKLLLNQTGYLAVVVAALNRMFSKASDDDIRAVAQGVVAIQGSFDTLSPLSPPDLWVQEQRAAILRLVSTLSDTV